MFAGIDVAAERHVLARLDEAGEPIGRPIALAEDASGYRTLLEALGPPPALVVIEATGHYWKNLYATLAASGHDVVLLNPIVARRFQEAQLERTKTDAIDAAALARLGFEKRPAPTHLHDATSEALRELVRHRDRLRQDFDDRVRQLHRLIDLGFPEFTRHVKGLDTMLATALIAECPTAEAFARADPRRLARLRYDGRHKVGLDRAEQLVAAARRSVGQHRGPVYEMQARHICQDLDLWRRRLTEIEGEIEGLLDAHEVGRLLTSIDGIGPHSAARIIATVGDPARFRSAGAFAAYVGVVPGLRQSGKRTAARAATAFGNARLRRALWMGAKTIELIHENVHVDAVRDDLDTLVLDAELLEAVLGNPDPEKKAKEISVKLAGRLRKHAGNPKFKALGERLEDLKNRHQQGLLLSIDFLKELLALAKDVVKTERETPEEEDIDRGKAALTELFEEARNGDTPVMVKRVVDDIDEIVRAVRFDGWQATHAGEREVKKALRQTLFRYKLHQDAELFEKAYGYIREYY